MALRVARGLFRLWLVLLLLWIGGVGVMTWRTFPSIPEPVLWGARQVDPSTGREFAGTPPWVIERRAAVQSAAVLAIVPPALVLALGSALLWAFRGFRRQVML